MGLMDYFSTRAETGDTKQEKDLQTHYYKVPATQVAQMIERLVHAKQWELVLANPEYQEYTIRIDKTTEAVLNVYNVSVLETAVDIYVNGTKMFGHSRKQIKAIYDYLDQQLPVARN